MSDSSPGNLNCFPNNTYLSCAIPKAVSSPCYARWVTLRGSIPHQLWIRGSIACRRMHFGSNSFSQAFATANAISHPISDIDRRLASGCPQREISQIDHTCWTNSSGRLLINTSNGAVPHDLAPLPSSAYVSVLYYIYVYAPQYSSNRHIIVMHI